MISGQQNVSLPFNVIKSKKHNSQNAGESPLLISKKELDCFVCRFNQKFLQHTQSFF